MTKTVGTYAMVLAAGLGNRMRPLTETTPKPLIKVAGKPIIDYGIERLRASRVPHIVVNCHYLGEQVIAWAAAQTPPIIVSDERGELLDTGGGILKALPLLGSMPFFVLNSDSIWTEKSSSALERLREAWDGNAMDCLLLLCPIQSARGYDGHGDFSVSATGQLKRERGPHTCVYIGAYLVSHHLFKEAPGKSFSMNALWDKAIARGRLFGLVHDGIWLHVGTPEAIPMAEAELTRTV
jgi:N-acetyl-alpha-D-muramate 1-phosphate uridylyltransferase